MFLIVEAYIVKAYIGTTTQDGELHILYFVNCQFTFLEGVEINTFTRFFRVARVLEAN